MREILQKIGLTRGEADVYLTLLKLGNTTSGALIKKSGVSRSKVYEVLERLKQKGLATEMIKHNTLHFEATTPNRIVDYVKAKEREIKETKEAAERLVPSLTKLQKSHLEKQETKIYTGLEGWRTLYSEILNNLTCKDEYLAFGVGPEELQDPRVILFFRKFHMKRAEKKIPSRLILSPKIKNLIKKDFAGLKHFDYRFLNTTFPTNINIHKDNVVTLVWGENPVAFVISSKQVADKYRTYFEELWKEAK